MDIELKDFKIDVHYKNGEQSSKENYGLNVITASIVEGIKMAISPIIYQNKMDGNVEIENKKEQLFIKFNLTPRESLQSVRQALAEMYTFQEIADDLG